MATIKTITQRKRVRTLSVETGKVFGICLAVDKFKTDNYIKKIFNLAIPFIIFTYEIKIDRK